MVDSPRESEEVEDEAGAKKNAREEHAKWEDNREQRVLVSRAWVDKAKQKDCEGKSTGVEEAQRREQVCVK
jgi:hypothetical protein